MASVGYEDNVMYQFEDNYRHSIYSTDGTFGDIEDAGGSPNPYAVEEDIITIDLFFGTIVNYQMNFMCDGQVVEFKNIDYGTIHSTHFREGYDYQESPCNDNSTLGDLNGDGMIDILDIILLVNIILADEYNSIADLNEDGELNILDVVIMVNLVLYDEPSICDGLTEVELWGEWYDIESTTYMDLQNQELTGLIPPEIGCLTNLTFLKLSSNQFSGELPIEIGNLTNLTYLYLDNNQLTGEIPQEIGTLLNLEELWLSGNQLTGVIPSEIGALTNLLEVYLSDNQLTGVIPSEIGSLTNLIELWLSNNQLTGEIPLEVCNLIEANNLGISNILEGNNLTNTCE